MSEPASALNASDSQASSVPAGYLARMLLMISLVLGVTFGLHAYIATRLISGFQLSGPAAGAAWAVTVALFLSLPLGMAASRLLPRAIGRAVTWVSYLWMGAFGLMVTAVAATDVLRLLVTLSAPEVGARAGMLQAWSVVGVTVPGLVIGLYRARRPVIERVKVSIPGLPLGLEGLTIAQLSDVHIGETLGKAFLEETVARVNALRPDLIAITGDLVDGSVHKLRDEVAPLADLSAPLGRYYVTGNHEYYHGGPAWEAEVARLGLTVLRNQHRLVERRGATLAVAGVSDLEARRMDPDRAPDVARALHGVPVEVPRLLLAHQPRAAALVGEERVDLQLSGHTHGGQIFPFMFFVRLQQPVVAGLRRLGKTLVYTSRGTGYWGPPVRIGAPPEITLLTLARGPTH